MVFESLAFIAFDLDADGWHIGRTITRWSKQGIYISIDDGHKSADDNHDHQGKDHIGNQVILQSQEIPNRCQALEFQQERMDCGGAIPLWGNGPAMTKAIIDQ